ncbi:unnamed protein product [Ilex paraguariensis]|uniref:N-acetyltransferase domain-containing protein n=1 Tax=Ilex paraguariensis TaxID=185542 RepID=A0ABC8TZC3_9AQUA
MTVLTSSSPLPISLNRSTATPTPLNCKSQPTIISVTYQSQRLRSHRRPITVASQLCANETIKMDKSTLSVAEATSEDELRAAACLRVRTFYDFRESFGIEDHKRYLAEREFEALKERVAGMRVGFRRVCCINATLPLSQISSISDDLCTTCKFSDDGEDHVVIGTLDLNQCLRLPDEITGMKPKGIGADFARAYLSNVCVAKELHRNGLGHALIAKSKMVAEDWGVSDLYVHVAVDNEPAKNLYIKVVCFLRMMNLHGRPGF